MHCEICGCEGAPSGHNYVDPEDPGLVSWCPGEPPEPAVGGEEE